MTIVLFWSLGTWVGASAIPPRAHGLDTPSLLFMAPPSRPNPLALTLRRPKILASHLVPSNCLGLRLGGLPQSPYVTKRVPRPDGLPLRRLLQCRAMPTETVDGPACQRLRTHSPPLRTANSMQASWLAYPHASFPGGLTLPIHTHTHTHTLDTQGWGLGREGESVSRGDTFFLACIWVPGHSIDARTTKTNRSRSSN